MKEPMTAKMIEANTTINLMDISTKKTEIKGIFKGLMYLTRKSNHFFKIKEMIAKLIEDIQSHTRSLKVLHLLVQGQKEVAPEIIESLDISLEMIEDLTLKSQKNMRDKMVK